MSSDAHTAMQEAELAARRKAAAVNGGRSSNDRCTTLSGNMMSGDVSGGASSCDTGSDAGCKAGSCGSDSGCCGRSGSASSCDAGSDASCESGSCSSGGGCSSNDESGGDAAGCGATGEGGVVAEARKRPREEAVP